MNVRKREEEGASTEECPNLLDRAEFKDSFGGPAAFRIFYYPILQSMYPQPLETQLSIMQASILTHEADPFDKFLCLPYCICYSRDVILWTMRLLNFIHHW